jgi:hypothetical protein
VAASTLFAASDPDGQSITTYALKNLTGNGHFVVNGVVQANNVEIDLTAAQLAQTTYVAGSGSDHISVRASDGTLWSAWQTATVADSAAPMSDALDETAAATSGMAAVLAEAGTSLPPRTNDHPASEAAVADTGESARLQVIALLNQYLAAGFQAREDAGAMHGPAAINPGASEAGLALFAPPMSRE